MLQLLFLLTLCSGVRPDQVSPALELADTEHFQEEG